MTEAASFTLYTGLAILLLYLMQWTGEKLDAIFVRLAAILFMAAGFAGGGGVVGETIDKAFNKTNAAGDEVARVAFGSVVMFLIWFGLAVMWILCILPERWFSKAIPDWLSVGGLVIPAGLAVIPGPAGDFLTSILTTISDVVSTPAAAIFGR